MPARVDDPIFLAIRSKQAHFILGRALSIVHQHLPLNKDQFAGLLKKSPFFFGRMFQVASTMRRSPCSLERKRDGERNRLDTAYLLCHVCFKHPL
jgi:hypothetical protein